MAERLAVNGADPARIAIHHLGVPSFRRGVPSATRGTGSRPLRVLIASSFRAKKGIPVAIEALSGVRQPGPAPASPSSATRRRSVRNSSKGRRILEIDRRAGHRPTSCGISAICRYADLLRLALDHDLLVAASMTAADGDSEGTPMALVELAATGVILVTTRHADIPEIVRRRRRPASSPIPVDRDEPRRRRIERARSPRPRAGRPIGAAARAHITGAFDADHAGADASLPSIGRVAR